MKKLFFVILLTVSQLSYCVAQTVTRTRHQAALATDQVSTGTVTIRTPEYICISTDDDKDQLIMDGTKFTMSMGGKKHVTDSKKNKQFGAFHDVLVAVINGKDVPANDELTVNVQNGQKTITITPAKKKRQMFTSFVLVVDAKTSAIRQLRMNERAGNYINYDIKW